jgi:hypothetical protein
MRGKIRVNLSPQLFRLLDSIQLQKIIRTIDSLELLNHIDLVVLLNISTTILNEKEKIPQTKNALTTPAQADQEALSS